jgi:hypothetical protein
MPRCLNLSELAYVRYRATEILRRRRPRRAGRVRGYAATPRLYSEARPARPPLVPWPRRLLDSVPLLILQTFLAGLQRLGVAV